MVIVTMRIAPENGSCAGASSRESACWFWTSAIFWELVGSHVLIVAVKTSVLWGMLILIPAMATAGATGASLGKKMRLPQVARKSGRMKIIAANGLLVLLPSAVFLAMRAQDGLFDTLFYTVQTVELLAGATNMTLLALNLKDGLSIAARCRRQP